LTDLKQTAAEIARAQEKLLAERKKRGIGKMESTKQVITKLLSAEKREGRRGNK
jgi:hypothetical protein